MHLVHAAVSLLFDKIIYMHCSGLSTLYLYVSTLYLYGSTLYLLWNHVLIFFE